jgi:ComF family protein
MLLDRLLALFAPHSCKACGQLGPGLCDECAIAFTDEPPTQCLLCSSPVEDDNLCRECRTSSPFDRAFVVGESAKVLKKLIYDFKFRSERGNVVSLSNLLDDIVPILPDGTVIVPIPTISAHIRQRGFGHAELIARTFARRRHLPYARLLRRENNVVMHGLKAKARHAAAETTFALNKSSRHKLPREILLIDDIFTTGATASTAARLLKDAGVKIINFAVIARHLKK